MKRIALVLAVALSLSVPSLACGAAKPSHATYALGHAKKCRVDFVKKTLRKTEVVTTHGKRKREVVRYVGCVYVTPAKLIAVVIPTSVAPSTSTSNSTPASVAPSPPVTLGAVDPSFTQDAKNPLLVTFHFSADATQTVGGLLVDLAQLGQLPAGILSFYVDGSLVSSNSVGGAVSTASVLVPLTATGAHVVVTTYVSGSTTATETDRETIPTYAATTTTSSQFTSSGSLTAPDGYQCTVNAGHGASVCLVYSAAVSSNGTSVTPGPITFTIYGNNSTPIGTFTTEAAGQTSCLVQVAGNNVESTSDCSGNSFSIPNGTTGYFFSAATTAAGYTVAPSAVASA